MLRAKAWACSSSVERLLQVDDVDAAALREDEAAHLGVPAARLVAEMDSGLQQLSHGDDGHWSSSSVLRVWAGGERMEPGDDARHRHPRWSAGSGAETPGILADALPTLRSVHGVVRLPAWDLAVECVDEALASGAVPSLERLGRLGQLGSLPSFIAALERGRRRSPSWPPTSPASARASGSRRPRSPPSSSCSAACWTDTARARPARPSTAASSDYVERVTGRARRQRAARSAHRPPQPRRLPRAARAGGGAGPALPGRLALVLFDLDHFKETNDREGHQEGDRLLRAFASGLAGTLRETDVAGGSAATSSRRSCSTAGPTDVDALLARLRLTNPRRPLGQRRRRAPARRVLDGRAACADRRPPPLLGQDGQGGLGPVQGSDP